MFSTPRALNEPVFWKSSAFNQTCVAQRVRGERRRPVDASADPLRRSEHVVAGHRHRRIVDSRRVDDHPDPAHSRRRPAPLAAHGLLPAAARDSALLLVRALVDRASSSRRSRPGSRRSSRAALPDGLHDFLAGYVRYATHLAAYLSSPRTHSRASPASPATRSTSRSPARAAEPLEDRAAAAARDPGAAAGGRARLGPAAAAARSRAPTPRRVRRLERSEASSPPAPSSAGSRHSCSAGCRRACATSPPTALGYGAQAEAYVLLLTDRYPNSDPDAVGPEWSLPPHQVQLELNDDGRRSRLTVFFRLLLALPHFVWLALWTALRRSWPRS